MKQLNEFEMSALIGYYRSGATIFEMQNLIGHG